MSFFEAFFLALIQGLTEFLPVSSSAHLILPSEILGFPDQGLAFDVAVHVGTLFAVMGYFRQQVWLLLTAFLASVFKNQHSKESRLAWMIVLATIPAGIIGLLLKDFVELYLRSTWVIAITCVVFGLLLWWVDAKAKQTVSEDATTVKSAFLIGLAQAMAIIPGTSRSGATMTMALYLGYTREAAARFSFLMSIPIILLAGGLLGIELVQSDVPVDWQALAIGLVVSFISAYLCIHWFLKLLVKVGMLPFVIYRILLGIVLAAYLTFV
ncbi:MAG: undecaprenyl-diphosphate phosphatase [Vibrionaceae bacterium]